MTSKSISDAVLDAFRVEHREHIEQIRELLSALEPGANVADDVRIQDAFRLAHSLKGGARVCDLCDAESLGHGLEAVLEQLNKGSICLTNDIIASINGVLDAIEDWMTAFDQQQPLPDTTGALAAIEHVLGAGSAGEVIASDRAWQKTKLVQVFRQEYSQHIERIQHFLAQWRNEDQAPLDAQLDDARRLAHTLAGAAAVVQMHPVEESAKSLEKLFQEIRQARRPFDLVALREMEERLASMAQNMDCGRSYDAAGRALVGGGRDGGEWAELPALDQNDIAPASPKNTSATTSTAASPTNDTVRLSVESLDRLMRSSTEMLADNQRVARLSRQLKAFQVEVGSLEQERETIRRLALPSLHKLASTPEFELVGKYLEFVDRQISTFAKRSRQLFAEQRRTAWLVHARCQQVQRDVCEARMSPAHSVFQGFRKMVRDLAHSLGKEVDFHITGLDVRADRMVLQTLKDPIMHALRNSVTHGIETPEQRQATGKSRVGTVALDLEIVAGRLHVQVDDDGQGVDVRQITRQAVQRGMLTAAAAAQQANEDLLSLVFKPGFSTIDSATELAGRGMGLSIVHNSVASLQGHVRIGGRPEGGARLVLSVPVSVSTHRVLLVSCGEQIFAVPTAAIARLLRVQKIDMDTVEGRPVLIHEGRPVRLVELSNVLGQGTSAGGDDDNPAKPVMLVKSGSRVVAIAVDGFIEERDAVMLNLDEFANNARFSGAILLEDGQVVLVLQTSELLDNAEHSPAKASDATALKQDAAPSRILIVDDSFTTRTLQKSILEANGYEVSVAVDGAEALSQLRRDTFALVISDVEMPRIDGFSLLEQMKRDRRLASTPVILVTSRDKREDRQRGLDLGAEAYIVKRKFDHQELLNTIQQVM